jgi:hypothetical protein
MNKCSTSFFEYMWSGSHDQAEDRQADSLGNWWCSKCSSQMELVELGKKLGFRAILDGKQEVIGAGQTRWVLYARTMGIDRVTQALKLIGKG